MGSKARSACLARSKAIELTLNNQFFILCSEPYYYLKVQFLKP